MTITGTGFGLTQSNSNVTFYGGVVAAVNSWSETEIVAVVPPEATTGPVSVTVAGITAEGPSFTLQATSQLTDSLGRSSIYTFAVIGGKWYLTDLQGSGCSSCSVRGAVHNMYDSKGNLTSTTDELGHTITLMIRTTMRRRNRAAWRRTRRPRPVTPTIASGKF